MRVYSILPTACPAGDFQSLFIALRIGPMKTKHVMRFCGGARAAIFDGCLFHVDSQRLFKTEFGAVPRKACPELVCSVSNLVFIAVSLPLGYGIRQNHDAPARSSELDGRA